MSHLNSSTQITPGIPLEQLASRNSSLVQCLIKHHYLSMYVSRYVAKLLWQRTFFFVQCSCTRIILLTYNTDAFWAGFYARLLVWSHVRPLQINFLFPVLLSGTFAAMQAGGPFSLLHYEIGSLSSHYLPNYSCSKQSNSILDCAFIFYTTRIKQMLFLLTHWHMSWQLHKTICKKNRKIIEEYGIMELQAGSIQMRGWKGNRNII